MKTSGSSSDRQSKQRGKRRWHTAFIAAPSQINLDTIKKLLREKGISTIVPSELSLTSALLLDHVTGAILKADLVIAILDPERSNANVGFELGYAYAMGKLVLVLVPPELKSLPIDLAGMLHIRADAENHEAIDFALDQLLRVVRPAKRKATHFLSKSLPIGQLADELIAKIESLGERATEKDITNIIVSALHASHVAVVEFARSRDIISADISIWDDELDPWVGNPFLIEIKVRFTSQAQVIASLNEVSTYLEKSNAYWALVLYVKGPPSAPDLPEVSASTVFFLEVREFLERLRTNSFGEIIRDLRNRRVHGRGF
jgi:nucleoside 2-deoxyribosyltransferase